jgi:ParB-like chromosome segregation protein Spo0J
MSAAEAYPSDLPTDFVRIHQVHVHLLRTADSPRLTGVDRDHSQLLAQLDAELPPILVHRPTMRVLDGIHRLDAVRQRGHRTINVIYHDGSLDEGFAEAVRSNISHGLPLSLAEREAAATRLLAAFPTWSDRAIAATAGLASGTVAVLRARHGLASPARRIGRDGRVRPLNGTSGRRAAAEFIAQNPDASLREIAVAAGISPVTARDVRIRLNAGNDIITPSQRRHLHAQPPAGGPDRKAGPPMPPPTEEPGEILRRIQHDPSLRFNDTGRTLLRWLAPKVFDSRKLFAHLQRVPPHSRYTLANLARACADEWRKMADMLDEESRTEHGDQPGSAQLVVHPGQ